MNPNENPKIEVALMGDYSDIQAVLNIANQYSIDTSGLRQWTVMSHVDNLLKNQIERGEMFIIRGDDAKPVAAIGISKDPVEWAELAKPDEAIYFYKWMKNPDNSHKNEGKALMKFAAEKAISEGLELLRCDTVTELTGLIKYYERLGFVQKGNFVYQSSGRAGLLMEAKAKTVLAKLGLD